MHLMIDIEALDMKPTTSILQIGAVRFDMQDGPVDVAQTPTCDRFCAYVKLTDALAGKPDADTLMWWLRQGMAREHLVAGLEQRSMHLSEALLALTGFIVTTPNLEGVWAHGSAFDLGSLQLAYARCDLQVPWHYRLVRDTRTLFAAKGLKQEDMLVKGSNVHDAVADCLDQIVAVRKAWNHR